MNLLKGILVLSAFCAGCVAGETVRPPMEDGELVTELARGNSLFALNLFRAVSAEAGNDNVFLSPYSISMALGMAYTGAAGGTADDMASVLGFPGPPADVARGFLMLTGAMNEQRPMETETGDPLVLSVSNGLWVQRDFPLLPEYTGLVTENFQAAVENLDFSGDAEGSRELINGHVAQATMDRILNLIPPGLLSGETRLVITNAVYFKGSWRHPFDPRSTAEQRFLLENGTAVTVPMMTQTEHFDYGESDEWRAVSMAYAGGGARMLLIMPEGTMQDFMEGFDTEVLETVRTGLTRRNVHLTMPLFEFTRGMPLGDVLVAMGMGSAFGERADFSGITGRRDLYISQVVHKAFVKVDEEGTEAAAATAVVMNLVSMPEPPVELLLNRPFIFLIEDTSTGSILFMGRVMDPAP